MTYKLSKRSKHNRKGVDKRLIEIDDLAIQLSLVDYGHGNDAGKRTAERQNELFKDGKSMVDGYDRLSKHQLGKALDYYAYVNGKASWEPHYMAMIAIAFYQAAAILDHKIEWGGTWKRSKPKLTNNIDYGWDMSHIQLDW
jgi:peptidoglycan L-alanyl-D-glutamate endopeptidase CwlK